MESKDLIFYKDHDCWYRYEDIQPTGVPYNDAIKRNKDGEVLRAPDTMTIEFDGKIGINGGSPQKTPHVVSTCAAPLASFHPLCNKSINPELAKDIIYEATEKCKKEIEELNKGRILEIHDLSKFSYIRVEAPENCFGNLFISTAPNSNEGAYLEKHEVQRLITFLQRAESEMR